MSMGIEISVFLAYAAAIAVVYCTGRFLMIPVKLILCIIGSSMVGGAMIILINYFGACWGLFVPVNLITAVVAGVLGIPGAVMLILFFV